MNFRDDHSKALWVERADIYWQSDLSPYELDMESLDERPSTLPVPDGTAARRGPHHTEGSA